MSNISCSPKPGLGEQSTARANLRRLNYNGNRVVPARSPRPVQPWIFFSDSASLKGSSALCLLRIPSTTSMSTTPLVLDTIDKARSEVQTLKRRGCRIGFVPTMGYLHEGHLSLVEIAKQHADVVLASIFVNPTQFNNPVDLEKYPRDIPRDLQLLGKVGTHGVFMPTPELMYSGVHESWVELSRLTADWEGAHRPGHFRGVTTVVSMLFNVVQPDVAVFGEKDFQQLRVIERMVDDLKFPLRIVRGALVR